MLSLSTAINHAEAPVNQGQPPLAIPEHACRTNTDAQMRHGCASSTERFRNRSDQWGSRVQRTRCERFQAGRAVIVSGTVALCTVGGRQSEAINAFVACDSTYSGRSTRVLLGSNMLQRQSVRPNQGGTAFRSITFTPVTMLSDRRKSRQASWHCQKVPQSTAQKVDLELAQVGYSDNLLACQQLPERLWQLNVSGSQVCCSDRTHRTQMGSIAGRTRVLTRRIVLGG